MVRLVFANTFFKLEVDGAKNMKEATETMEWLIKEQKKTVETWKYNNINDPVGEDLRQRIIESTKWAKDNPDIIEEYYKQLKEKDSQPAVPNDAESLYG